LGRYHLWFLVLSVKAICSSAAENVQDLVMTGGFIHHKDFHNQHFLIVNYSFLDISPLLQLFHQIPFFHRVRIFRQAPEIRALSRLHA